MSPTSSASGTGFRSTLEEPAENPATERLRRELRALGFTMTTVVNIEPGMPTLELVTYALDPDGLVHVDPERVLLRCIEDRALLLGAAIRSGELTPEQIEHFVHGIQRQAAVGVELRRRCAAVCDGAGDPPCGAETARALLRSSQPRTPRSPQPRTLRSRGPSTPRSGHLSLLPPPKSDE